MTPGLGAARCSTAVDEAPGDGPDLVEAFLKGGGEAGIQKSAGREEL